MNRAGFPSAAAKEALQAVGTGKKGSHACPQPVADAFAEELRKGQVSGMTQAAFFAALFLKRPEASELMLLEGLPEGAMDSAEILAGAFCDVQDVSLRLRVHTLCTDLLKGKILSESEALEMGRFLFLADGALPLESPGQGDAARALMASVLRMRHTEPEEYAGLIAAMHERLAPEFRGPMALSVRRPLIQLADPFDGMERVDSTVPVLAASLVRGGAQVIHMCGPSSGESAGPKFGLTPGQWAEALEIPRIRNFADLGQFAPMGVRACQDDLSPAVARWVSLRRHTVKRPFLATLEKFLNPWKADIFFSSAFHANFNEKMLETAEAAGFPASIVTFKGLEGSLSLSLARGSTIVASARTPSGHYERKGFEFRGEMFGFAPVPDPKTPRPTAETMAQKVKSYLATQASGDSAFDSRAAYTVKAYSEVLAWVKKSANP